MRAPVLCAGDRFHLCCESSGMARFGRRVKRLRPLDFAYPLYVTIMELGDV